MSEEAVKPVKKRGVKKVVIGTVAKKSGDKTVSVVVSEKVRHPMIKKFVTKKFKFLVHDEKNQSQQGDLVKITETRPTSKNKRWRLVEIVKH